MIDWLIAAILIAVMLVAVYLEHQLYMTLKMEVAALEKELECLLGSD